MQEPIVIWGAGAIGGTIGAYLIRSGLDVRLIDADQRHVAAINQAGLRIEGPIDSFTARASALTPDQVSGSFRRILLAVKGHHAVDAARALAPVLAPDGFVLSLQNGLNDRAIGGVIGHERVVLSLVNFAADVTEPGVIHYGGRGRVLVGEPDGRFSARVKDLVSALRHFDPSVEASDNIRGYLWGKLGYGGLLIATALTNERMADLLGDPAWQPILARVACEVMEAAAASGVRPAGVDGFDADAFQRADAGAMRATFEQMADHYRHSAKERSGVWRDLAVRKRKTEVAELMAPVVAAGRAHGLAMPVLARLIEMIGEIEAGRRNLDLDNLRLLAKAA